MADTILKGTIICLETGACDDQYIVGHFVAKRDIPFSEWNGIRDEFDVGHERVTRGCGDDVRVHEMTAEMIRQGMIADAPEIIEHHADDPMESPEPIGAPSSLP